MSSGVFRPTWFQQLKPPPFPFFSDELVVVPPAPLTAAFLRDTPAVQLPAPKILPQQSIAPAAPPLRVVMPQYMAVDGWRGQRTGASVAAMYDQLTIIPPVKLAMYQQQPEFRFQLARTHIVVYGLPSAVLVGNVATSVSTTGQLTGKIALLGNVKTSATARAPLTTKISINGKVQTASAVRAALTALTGFGGVMQASGSTRGAFSTSAGLTGRSQASTATRAALKVGAGISGRVQGSTRASGSITTRGNASLLGAVSACGSINGRMTVVIHLAGATAAQTALQGSLTSEIILPSGVFSDAIIVRAKPLPVQFALLPLPYGEFYGFVGDRLQYGIDWADWLANRWRPNTAAPMNQVIRPSVPNGYQYVCTTAGQTGAQEPTWPAYVGAAVLDGSAQWACEAMSTASLEATISQVRWTSVLPLTSMSISDQTTLTLVDTTMAVAGTDYDVLCTVDTSDGQQKVGKIRIKVR